MSRAYWVKLASSVSTSINAKDKAVHKVDVDAVVPEGEMDELLRQALEDAGWSQSEEDDDVYDKTMEDGIELSWNLETNTVEATVESDKTVVKDIEVQGRGYDQSLARADAERQVARQQKAAKAEASIEEERLQKKLTEKLGDNEGDRVREINEVLQKTYAEAVKRKARRLGNVTSVSESDQDGDYQLTIVIAE